MGWIVHALRNKRSHPSESLFTLNRNGCSRWTGIYSFPLDAGYLYWALRYVERNPVRAGMVRKAEDYRWSSAKVHVKKEKDELLSDFYLTREIRDWRRYLEVDDKEEQLKMFRKHIETGRPLGSDGFITELERKLGIALKKKKPGPKPGN